MSKVRIFLASSLDGFIAGPNDDLSWLPDPAEGDGDFGYSEHMAHIGCLLWGRRTYDVVQGLGGGNYPAIPLLVATRRPLDATKPGVVAVAGSIEELIEKAREAAAGKDVYLDGGDLIRQALDAALIDVATIAVVPMVLGEGIPLFAGCRKRHSLKLESSHAYSGGMVHLVYRSVKD